MEKGKGIQGKYKGITKKDSPKLRFEVSGGHGLVETLNNFMIYFDHECIPVCRNRHTDKWEIEVFPADDRGVQDFANDNLTVDHSYRLKLELKRWQAGFGEGFSLYIRSFELEGN